VNNIKNSLVLKNINYKIDNQIILKDINLEVKKGDFISLLGESGSGKSTILKIISGIIDDYQGDVYINNKNVNKVKTKNRKACIVFQDYLLFPHLNVYENIAFGLKARKENKDYIKKRVKSLIELTKLEDCEYKYENQLSGGQRQRVAIARALAISPDILLLDEPFSSLDDSLKDDMRNFLLDIRKKIDITTILVTHDKKEAFFMSKKIAVLMDNKIISYQKPFDLYKYPKTKKLADFLEERNYISGYIHDGKFNYKMKNVLDFSCEEAIDESMRSFYESDINKKVNRNNLDLKEEEQGSFKKMFENINEQKDGYSYKSFDLSYIKSKKSIFSFSEENLFELCDHIKCDLMINKENIKIYLLRDFYKKYMNIDDDGCKESIKDYITDNILKLGNSDFKDFDYKLTKADYKKIYNYLMILNNSLYENLKACSLKDEYIKFFMGRIKKIKFRGSKMSYYIKALGFLDFYINIDIDSNENFNVEDIVVLKIDLEDVLFFDRV
jgi:ABC-type Fe3+/spermidine/putrescine transport system ATPase subunit